MNSYTSWKALSGTEASASPRANYLRPVGSTIARGVPYNLRKVLSVIHNEDVTEHLEMREIRRDALNLFVLVSRKFTN